MLFNELLALPLSLIVESIIFFGESTTGFGAEAGANQLQDTTAKVIAITLAMAIIPFFILQILNVINLSLIHPYEIK